MNESAVKSVNMDACPDAGGRLRIAYIAIAVYCAVVALLALPLLSALLGPESVCTGEICQETDREAWSRNTVPLAVMLAFSASAVAVAVFALPAVRAGRDGRARWLSAVAAILGLVSPLWPVTAVLGLVLWWCVHWVGGIRVN